jgi:hypothetical protein
MMNPMSKKAKKKTSSTKKKKWEITFQH